MVEQRKDQSEVLADVPGNISSSQDLDIQPISEKAQNASLIAASAVGDIEKIDTVFTKANEGRDFTIYNRAMDAATEAKAKSIFPHFGEVPRDAVIVDAGSGTGALAQLAAREFRDTKAKVYALDISHELSETAGDKMFLERVYGDARKQNFPNNSVDRKYYSTSGHEIETFGGPGSMEEAVKSTFEELKPGGKLVIRDFAKPSLTGPIYMKILSTVGIDTVPEGVESKALDYNILSAKALFERFHKEFKQGDKNPAFSYERVTRPDGEYLKIEPEWAHEFYLRKDYTANWRQEIKEKYTYWTKEQAMEIMKNAGYEDVQVHEDPNEYILNNRLKGKIALFREGENGLEPMEFPATHMVVVGQKPKAADMAEPAPSQMIMGVDYGKILADIHYDGEKGTVKIGEKQFTVEAQPLTGTKKRIFSLKDQPNHVLKVVREDTNNHHSAFKSIYQVALRQKILEQAEVPHLKVTEQGPEQKPPYSYLIQEKAPEGSISAAQLVEEGSLTEEDIRQMCEIINSFELGKQWQVDTNPFSWFRVTKNDGTTQMVYASGKVYHYDENWEFRKVGLLQWLDPSYVKSAKDFSAAIPRTKDYQELKEKIWKQEGRFEPWKKYLHSSLLP